MNRSIVPPNVHHKLYDMDQLAGDFPNNNVRPAVRVIGVEYPLYKPSRKPEMCSRW